MLKVLGPMGVHLDSLLEDLLMDLHLSLCKVRTLIPYLPIQTCRDNSSVRWMR